MRQKSYEDLVQSKSRKKFVLLVFLLVLLTAICLCLTTVIFAATQQNLGSHAHVHFEPKEDFTYSANSDGTYTVTGLNNPTLTEIVIPSEYNGSTVTSIGANAFDGNTTMTSLTIPETITSIGKYAFRKTSNLEEINYNVTSNSSSIVSILTCPFYQAGKSTGVTVNFGADVVRVANYLFYTGFSSYAPNITKVNFKGNKVKTIGDEAFRYCSKLTSITIPDSVTGIGYCAFASCSGLISIKVDSGNTYFTSHNKEGTKECNCIIDISTKTLVVGCSQTTIPDDGSVTSIGRYAFEGRRGLTSITIPSSVETIGGSAFQNCGLTSITIPSSVESIVSWAFSGCSNLKKVTIDSVYAYNTATAASDVCGYLLKYIITKGDTVKVLKSIVDDTTNTNSYLNGTKFTKIEEGDYYVYTYN